MMTVEDTHNIPLSSSTDTRPVIRQPQQHAPIQIECRTLVNTQSTLDTAQVHSVLEYTISLPELMHEDHTSGYGTITLLDAPSPTEYCRFVSHCNQKREDLDRNLLQVGKLVLQRHKELYEYARIMKDQYENTYALYQVEYPNFIFRYDTTKCRKPEDDLDTGDIRYSIQMAQYYLDLKLHLDEAYRIHKKCVYYHNQIRIFMKRADTLGACLGREGYRKFTDTHPYHPITFAPYTEAYVRAHRNQWARRVYDLELFSTHYTRRSTADESLQQDPDVSPLTPTSSWTQDAYDPFADDNDDDARTLFSDPQDYLCEANVHAYALVGNTATSLLDVHLLDDQNSRIPTDVVVHQPYEQEARLAPPTLPTAAEIQTYVHTEVTNFRKRRQKAYANKKKYEKRQRLLAAQEKSLMVRGFDIQDADKTKQEQDLIFDSGCTAHMWNHRAHFTSFEPYTDSKLKAACANGTVLDIMGKGDIGPLKNVLYVPGLHHCLISGTALLKQGYGMYIGTVPKVIKESNPDVVLLRGHFANDLFRISAKAFEQQLGLRPVTCYVHEISTQHLLQLHQMLGHASATRCAHECKCTKFPGLANLSSRAFQTIQECEECALAKAKRRSFTGHLDIPDYVGQTWYVDVKGPVAIPSLEHGNHYVFGIIDGKSKFLIQYFMKTKDQVLEMFKNFHDEFIPFVRAIQPALGAITVYSDMGEFNCNAVIDYCQAQGILHRTTCAYSPENNGLIERTWRTITEASIAMLLTANLSEPYWEEARRTAGYIRNRIVGGHPSIDASSPYQKFFGVRPHIRHFKVFGVWAYPRMPIPLSNHHARADKGIFVGYSDEAMGGYRIYFPVTHTFGHSNHVTFGKSPNRSNDDTEWIVTNLDDMVGNLHLELMYTPSPKSSPQLAPEVPAVNTEHLTEVPAESGSSLEYVYNYSLIIPLFL